MKMLKLPGIKHTYFPVKTDYRYEIYYNCFTNNMIVFSTNDEYIGVEIQTICNLTEDKYYKYLAKELNEKEGLLVRWTQGKSECGQYTVYYDLNPNNLLDKKYETLLDVLREVKRITIENNYTVVVNGEEYPID